jgi:HK97 family phage portal protein
MNLTLLDLSEAKTKLAATGERTLRLNSAEQFADIFTGLKTAAGKLVTRETAMRCGAVLACVRIIMEDVGTLPFILKKKTTSGATDATDHPAYRLLKIAPNPFQTSLEVKEHLIMDCILNGRGVAWAQRNGKGELIAVWPLHSERLTFQGQLQNGDLRWRYSSIELDREFTQHELWRTNMLSQYIVDGRALIFLAREAIGLAMAAEEQGARLFSNGIQTNIALTAAGDLGEEARTTLLESLDRANVGSGNAYRPLLLENGLNVTPIGLTAQESQYIESRNYQLSDIARIFRIPEVMLGISGSKSATFAAASEFFGAYSKNVIQPWCVRFEQTAERDLLLPSETEYFFKHNLSALLRADKKTRYETHEVGIRGGFLSRQEARVDEELDEVKGLDRFLVPMNTQILDENGNLPAPPAPVLPPAPPGTPKQDPNEKNLSLTERRLLAHAARIADAIIKAENRVLLKRKGSINRAWHTEKVQDLTGCTLETAEVYSAWRCDNQDPLNGKTITEARERLILLCLEANNA